jgi:hypothetical protein
LGKGHILARNIAVQDRLIERVAAFDGDVIHSAGKLGIANQSENKIIQVFLSVSRAHAHDFIFTEQVQNGLLRRFGLRSVGLSDVGRRRDNEIRYGRNALLASRLLGEASGTE